MSNNSHTFDHGEASQGPQPQADGGTQDSHGWKQLNFKLRNVDLWAMDLLSRVGVAISISLILWALAYWAIAG